uniref:Uncharacterized protein n=1 Tax=Echinococcus canadensis TaxID=519352 RepID=A0A915EYC0_9CEST
MKVKSCLYFSGLILFSLIWTRSKAVEKAPSFLGCSELEYQCDTANGCGYIGDSTYCVTTCTMCTWCVTELWKFKRMCRPRMVFCCAFGKCHFFGLCSDLNIRPSNQSATQS